MSSLLSEKLDNSYSNTFQNIRFGAFKNLVNLRDALTLGGKKKKLTRVYFERFDEGLGLTQKQIQGVFKRFIKNKEIAITWINESFLSDERSRNILKFCRIVILD